MKRDQSASGSRATLKSARLVVLVGATLVVSLLGSASTVFAASQQILSSGPLTRVEISDELNCAVDHAGDTYPEFFGDTACATLLATGGTLFGPSDIPAGGAASPLTVYTHISQSAVMGAGTNADPYRIVTVVELGSTGLQISQTDSYVVGQETYRTDATVSNSGNSAASAILYRAGDCFLQDSDEGFGAHDAASGSVSCVAGMDDGTGNIVPGTRIEQWYPLSSGSSYTENGYSEVWGQIGTQNAFPDDCTECANYIDNGAGLSWNINVPAHGSITRSNLTVFSPLGNVPLSTTKTAAQSSVDAGASDSYTITVSNTNNQAVTIDSIDDTLPAGFTYTPGSSSGATTADPTVSNQDLTWAGPFTAPANGSITLTFSVTVSSTPGTYNNSATASAESPYTVVGTGPTAPVTVNGTTTPAHLTLVKVVDNTGGGTAQATDWILYASGPTPIYGSTGDPAVTNAPVDPGTYDLSESGPSGYTPSDWACTFTDAPGTDQAATGTVVLSSGEYATCTITNTYTQTGGSPAYVSILMDRSYSMHKHRGRTIDNFNQWLYGEQQMAPDALATMQLFNSCRYHQRGAAGQAITDLPGLSKGNYHPACRTPLYDAIAKTINRAAASPYSAGGNVEIVVYTDGMENASKTWDQQSVDALIAEKMAEGWTFTWLGNSHDPLIVKWRDHPAQ